MREISTYAVGVGPQSGDVDAAFMDAARACCLAVHPYTVDDATEMQRLTVLGVDGIFTNMPDRLLSTRPADEARGLDATCAAARASRACRGKR